MMRFVPIFLLTGLLVTTGADAPNTDIPILPGTHMAMCWDSWAHVQQAVEDRDRGLLWGMLFRRGVTVASLDGSVSKASLVQAAGAWNDALRTHLIRLVHPGEEPTVQVVLRPLVNGRDDLQGEIVVTSRSTGQIDASVQIGRSDLGRNLTEREIGSVLTHELGHLLGLDDAPADAPPGTCVMAEFDPTHLVTKPSPLEAKTVSELRTNIRFALTSIR